MIIYNHIILFLYKNIKFMSVFEMISDICGKLIPSINTNPKVNRSMDIFSLKISVLINKKNGTKLEEVIETQMLNYYISLDSLHKRVFEILNNKGVFAIGDTVEMKILEKKKV